MFLNFGLYKYFVVLNRLGAIQRKPLLVESTDKFSTVKAVNNNIVKEHSEIDSGNSIENVEETDDDLRAALKTEEQQAIPESDEINIVTGHYEIYSGNSIQNVKESDTDLGVTLKTKEQQSISEADEIEKKFEILLGCRKLPDILTIGFEKCGTVTLGSYLRIHPQIFKTHYENYHLFDYNSEISVQWYTRHKPCTTDGQLRMHKLAVAGRAPKAYKVVPNAKLLAIVRDPVDRAMSHHVHRIAKGIETKQANFDSLIASMLDKGEPLTANGSVLFKQSSYLERLRPWIDQYGLDKIHIVDGDNFVKNPVQELQDVERFLGLAPFITKDHFVYNESKGFYCLKMENDDTQCMSSKKGRPHPQMSNKTRTRLQEYFKPLNENFFKAIGRNFSWND